MSLTIRLAVVTLLAALAASPAFANEPARVDPGQLAGNTLSAVAFVPRQPGEPWAGQLRRMMLQAYLAPDGSTVVRQWLPERNSYSLPARTNWSLSDNRLCIEMPAGQTGVANRSICALVHVWWPRIAGVGTQPYAMLDGDLQRGNLIASRAQR